MRTMGAILDGLILFLALICRKLPRNVVLLTDVTFSAASEQQQCPPKRIKSILYNNFIFKYSILFPRKEEYGTFIESVGTFY